MFKRRVKKVLVIVSLFFVIGIVVIYQFSYSEAKQENIRELASVIERSLKEGLDPKSISFKTNLFEPWSKSVAVYSEGEQLNPSKDLPSLFSGDKIVHIDLKGAPLKISYYKEFFPIVKSLGATGLLIEYEDMFPYSNTDIPASTAYTIDQIKSILKAAAKNKLEVIPLVQTFGHLEFVLKLKEFQHLREVSSYPQVICPTRNGTSQLLRGMIDDIIALHPASKYLHIGCDEVYNLGECDRCVDTMMKKNWTKKQLFLDHITSVASYIKEKYPSVKPLTWDDEFRGMSEQELIAAELGSLLEPVVWKYTPSIDSHLSKDIWDKYATVFGSVWIASAFKGATGSDKIITDISYHLENHRSWMKQVATYKDIIKFKGIMLTGWQRYDHFAVLCELLPVGLPSLAVNLAYILQANIDMQSVPKFVVDTLKCGPGLLHPRMAARCHFPGAGVYEKTHQLVMLLDQIAQMEELSEVRGWLSEYNIRTGFSSPAHVEGATNEVDRFKMELMYLEQDLRRTMSEMYDNHTVTEWTYTFINPPNSKLQTMWEAKEKLLSVKVWPRRPLQISTEEL